VLAVNNGSSGIAFTDWAEGVRGANLASLENGSSGIEVQVFYESGGFTGALLVSGNGTACSAYGYDGSAGLVSPACTQSGTEGSSDYPGQMSDAVLRTGFDASGIFAGRIATNDIANASDTNGGQAFASISDWVSFDNAWRVWGKADVTAFPADADVGRCVSGDCRIWDYRLSAGDAQLRNTSGDGRNPNTAFVDGAPCPDAVDGDRVLGDRQNQTYLINATEMYEDGVGDDDGLCESGEACIYSPNFGAYQGEGSLDATCIFADGAVQDVTMYAYAQNGAE
jgi:hypothetical protein